MNVYVGQTRSRALIEELSALGFGEITQPDEWAPRRSPVVLDNGAFKAWKAGESFNETLFMRAVDDAARFDPDFIVTPDIVAGGSESLSLSLEWSDRLSGAAPLALVVQDGMGEREVRDALAPFSTIFVGGTLPWKMATGQRWVQLAHANGRRCHIGRAGSVDRVKWAKRIGADSIDSCLPLWSKDKLRRFVAALHCTQLELWPGGSHAPTS